MNNIVMWETLQNSADWDCFKTPTLQEISRIPNLHQMAHCACLEVIRLFHSVGCVRNKLQCRTIQPNQKSFLWTSKVGRFTRAWFVGYDRRSSWKHESEKSSAGRLVHEPSWGSCSTSQTSKNERNLMEWLMIVTMLIFFLRTSVLLVKKHCCIMLEDNDAVIKMTRKEKKSDNETCFQNPQSCFWLVVRSNQFAPKNQKHMQDTKTQLADILTKGSFTRDEWNHLLCLFNISHFSSTKRLEVMLEKNARRCRWRKSHSKMEIDDEFCLAMQRKDSQCECLYFIRKPEEDQRWKSNIFWARERMQQPRMGWTQLTSCSSNCSEWNVDDKWPSQERKFDEVLDST